MNQIPELVVTQRDVLIALFSFAGGAALGHWFALSRDRRKEFNDACEPLRKWALQEARRPAVYSGMPSAAEWDTLEQRLGYIGRRRLRSALQAHDEARRKQLRQDATGGARYESSDEVRRAAQAILDLLKLR